jgi:hypothetical protein
VHNRRRRRKIAEQSWNGYVHQQVAEGFMTDEEEASEALNPPDYKDILTPKEAVLATSRLNQDLMALRKILSANHPQEPRGAD